MAIHDVKVVETKGATTTFWQVQDRTSSSQTATIKPGEPVKQAADGSPYVIPLADGDPEIGTDLFVGIARTESTETSSADGKVEVLVVVPGQTVLEAKATTAANVDTESELNALVGDCVTFDLASGVFTVDENQGNDNNVNGLQIVGGDHTKQTLRFVVKDPVTTTGATL